MAKLSLQFHARREEVARLVAGWATDLGLWVAYETLSPSYLAVLVTSGGSGGVNDLSDSVSRIVLGIYPLEMRGGGPFGLIGSNPNSLSILLGRETAGSLGLSLLQAMTDDAKSLSQWKVIRRKTISQWHKGARVISSLTGASAEVKDHYYSDGAKQLAENGAKMLGLTEMQSFTFG